MPLDVKVFAIDDLQPFEGNPRIHNDALLQESLKAHGQFKPIVVNAGSHTGRVNEILAGNGTLEAARSIGWTKIDGVLLDVDDITAKKINVIDNRSNDVASYDNEMLAALLSEIASEDDLAGTGFSEKDLEKMLGGGDKEADGESRMGDLEYRVIVDCRDEEDQGQLMEALEAEGRNCRDLTIDSGSATGEHVRRPRRGEAAASLVDRGTQRPLPPVS
jgi:ParB-like chromosome segregation protein Spo0J